jgi:hypothetical protein
MVSDKTDIFFDDIYAGTDNVWKTNSTATVLQKAGTYYARFDVVVGKDTNYQDLLALSRTNNLANMNNIVYSKSFKENADLFTCTTTSLDTLSSHDINYYFPTDGNVCKIEAHSNLQSGVEWKTNYLPKGTYSFAIKFTVSPTAEDNSTITINYRAKEKDTNGEFETILKEISFDLNQPLRAGVNFGAIVNSSPVELQRNQTNSNTLTGKTTPIVFPNEQNNVRFRIYNRTQTSLQNGTITAYSYKAINSISDFTTPISSTKVGISKFDSLDGNSSKVLGTNLSISAFNSKEFAFNFYPSIPNSSDWSVIVADFGANSYKIFLNTTAQGVTPIIDAEFLAGVKDQNFDGRAYDKTNRSELVTLKSVSVDVYKNCNSAGIGTLVYSGLSATLDKDYFYVTIPGVYQAGRDCLKLKVTASNSSTSYSPLVKTIFAGYGGTIDPSLACIDVTPQELSDNLTEFSIKWGASKKVIVTNNCTRPVVVKMSTGLICASPTNSNCENEVTINANEAKEYTITGTNVDYVPSSSTQPNYSDVLGLFPIQVKAKFPSVSKKFAIAQMLNAHLTNPNECFAISKDLFDFTAQNAPNKMDFNINNDCQYTLSGDYYIPKADLSIIGADLNNSVPKYSLVDFNYSLQVTSGGYTTTYLSEIQKTPVFFSKNATDVNSTIFGEVRKYSTFHFVIPTDYNGDSNRMYVKWMDVNNGALYGAKVDGNIIVNYKNGSSVSVSPRVTFDLNYPTKCVCDGHVANNTCQLSGNEDHCIIAPEISDVYDAGYDSNYMYGIAYVSFPKGSISSIDFNMIGNIDQNDLIIAARTWVYENKQVPQIIPNGNMSTENYALGRFRIYPVEGMTFILMNYGRVATSYADQIKNNYCLEHLSERAWMDNGAVYFTNTLFSNQTNASRSCTDTNFFAGQSSTLAGSIPTNILTDINSSSLNWISRDTNSGFWLSTCTVADCNVLKRTANSFVLSQSISTILGHYAPLCVTNYPTVPNSAPPTDSECNSLGIICTTNSTGKSCTLPQNLLLNTFDNSFFLNKTNPSVNVKVNSVKSGTRVLNNNSVVIWVEGGLLKATFLGEDYLPYNDGSIEFTLNNTEQLGNQYGLVNIVDYVNDGRVKNE